MVMTIIIIIEARYNHSTTTHRVRERERENRIPMKLRTTYSLPLFFLFFHSFQSLTPTFYVAFSRNINPFLSHFTFF